MNSATCAQLWDQLTGRRQLTGEDNCIAIGRPIRVRVVALAVLTGEPSALARFDIEHVKLMIIPVVFSPADDNSLGVGRPGRVVTGSSFDRPAHIDRAPRRFVDRRQADASLLISETKMPSIRRNAKALPHIERPGHDHSFRTAVAIEAIFLIVLVPAAVFGEHEIVAVDR